MKIAHMSSSNDVKSIKHYWPTIKFNPLTRQYKHPIWPIQKMKHVGKHAQIHVAFSISVWS